MTTTHEITESDTRATRLTALEAQVCQARSEIQGAALCGEPTLALDAVASLATLLQHTLQELAQLATELRPS
ncbi:hypothetical protein [Pseudonocardia xinjiangensis]|uniref:Uncharacterized protein n=1 Tax=Pseudonocardia xinjiangensis TaxID=75289 RepID=A0ABX1R907_9PSEU|nr:hypothetical protein [Pseudonocardia xinjiangensis]NMH75671.1 hypothetical protein [Pseudonocardia xinjiangensis]